jgi:hypothetical protein
MHGSKNVKYTENVIQLKNLGAKLQIPKVIHEKTKSKLKSN